MGKCIKSYGDRAGKWWSRAYGKGISMKKSILTVVFLISLLYLSSCNKNLMIGNKTGNNKDGYDIAAYNYVYVEALKQKLMGNGGDALKYFEQCLKINPNSDAAYYQMAQVVINNGDLKNGKLFTGKALEIDPDNIWYLTMLGGLYYQEKNIDSAIIFYERAIKLFPDKENLDLTLGNLYSEAKKYDKANSIFESFDKKYGVNETSTLSSIRNLMAENKYDEAMNKTLNLLKEYPDELMYNGVLADIYRSKGDKEKAIEVYNRLLEKNPDNPQVQLSLCDFLLTEKSYNDLFILLHEIILNNNIEKENKISLLAKIIEIPDLNSELEGKLIVSLMVFEASYKGDNIISLLRPEFLINENKISDAISRLEEIINENPDNYYAWEKLLILYLQSKDYGKLLKRGEECATKFNTSFPAKILYANGALELGKYSLALDELKKAEILAADNKEFLVQVLTMRADIYYRMKEYMKAFETFKEAMKTNNNDLTVINNYAYYLAEQNTNLKEAEEMAKRVIEKEKGNSTYLDTYGWVLYKRGKLQEAAKIMEAAIKSGNNRDAVMYEHLGYILKKQKNCNEAIKNWNIAIKMDSTKTELIKEIENCGK
jgi:tetratricopeptide (TPR) repeat protein